MYTAVGIKDNMLVLVDNTKYTITQVPMVKRLIYQPINLLDTYDEKGVYVVGVDNKYNCPAYSTDTTTAVNLYFAEYNKTKKLTYSEYQQQVSILRLAFTLEDYLIQTNNFNETERNKLFDLLRTCSTSGLEGTESIDVIIKKYDKAYELGSYNILTKSGMGYYFYFVDNIIKVQPFTNEVGKTAVLVVMPDFKTEEYRRLDYSAIFKDCPNVKRVYLPDYTLSLNAVNSGIEDFAIGVHGKLYRMKGE